MIACTTCREPVRVYEAPVPWIDPDDFVCDECLGGPALFRDGGRRSEHRPYDPSTVRIPF